MPTAQQLTLKDKGWVQAATRQYPLWSFFQGFQRRALFVMGVPSSYNSRPERQGRASMSSFRLRFKHIVTKHQHWLTFAGAFIVFMTFIVKEGLRDHWERTAGAINAVQSAYAVRGDISELTQEIYDIEAKLHDHEMDEAAKANKLFDYNAAKYRLEEMYRRFAQVNGTSRQIGILVRILPENDANRKKAREIDEGLKTSRNNLIWLDSKLRKSTLGIENEEEWERKALEVTGEAEQDEEEALRALMNDSEKLTTVVFDDAEAIRKRNEKYAAIAWWITAALFVIGWGLGLLGKVYRVPEATGGD
jgi:hypothetical protein